ncbi:Cell division protein FtsP [Paraburkholderia rhynchosiae]|uniref:Cell division protein FtsP n=2 Tax=Paraburkholderia rhynchosiae TaxID=487049 RepID=A0A2N7WK52_9BURK|nr:hypothetical protein C0Z16_17265 [Paraburkholderia rhynchosiae]CAB3698677.1 Cell division protein FtsP [Paraburkholderia rhynchosiae]
MLSRRTFLGGSGAALLGAALVSKAGAASLPEAPTMQKTATQPPLMPPNGRPYTPVATLNGWTLPWRMKNGWKEFHLTAEPVVREVAPGMKANLWGYNGQAPGPTIEAVEGDKVRIFVTNKLPEHTTVHWQGMRVPCGMDGVGGLTQPHIPPGKTFVYEFKMPLPDNTLPMMTGTGPFGALEMGGMFSVVKVREGLGRNDYRDPGWFRHPKGTVAFEYTGELPES